ncbi:MAG: hypothetical protein GEU80_01760 [Dehalococcoidia bacterium]|nr:hypothetical protein [Dehalococcoidia bacterium]
MPHGSAVPARLVNTAPSAGPPDGAAPLAIEGGDPVRTTPFPADAAREPVTDQEPVTALEAEFAHFLDVPPWAAVACASPAGARTLALDALALPEHGEVVVPALLAEDIATACLDRGWRVVPAEVDTDAVTLAPRGLAGAVSERSGLAVITHAYGHPASMPELMRLAADHDIPALEDATSALGASSRGQAAGTFGDIALFAFGAGHLIDAPGALLVARDEGRARDLRAARDGAAGPELAGTASVALAQLRDARERLEARRRLAWHLTEQLRGMRAVVRMPHGRHIRHAYDCYVVRLRSLLWSRSVEESVAALRAEGIPCEPAARPSLHRDGRVREPLGEADPRLAEERFPVSIRLPGEMLRIPLPATATTRDMDDVAAALRKLEHAST